MEDKGIEFTNNENRVYSYILRLQRGELTIPLEQKYMGMIRQDDAEIGAEQPMPPEYLAAFADLWADKGVQFAMEKGNEYALQDNLS